MLKSAGKWLKTAGSGVWRQAGRAITALKDGAVRLGSRIARGVPTLVAAAKAKAVKLASGLVAKTQGAIAKANGFLHGIGGRVRQAADAIGARARGIADRARGLIGKVVGALPGPVRGAFDAISATVARAVDFARKGLASATATVSRIARRVADKLAQARERPAVLTRAVVQRGRQIADRMRRWVAEQRERVADKVDKLRAGGIRSVGRWLKTAAKLAKAEVVAFVQEKFRAMRERITGWLKDRWEAFKAAKEGETTPPANAGKEGETPPPGPSGPRPAVANPSGTVTPASGPYAGESVRYGDTRPEHAPGKHTRVAGYTEAEIVAAIRNPSTEPGPLKDLTDAIRAHNFYYGSQLTQEANAAYADLVKAALEGGTQQHATRIVHEAPFNVGVDVGTGTLTRRYVMHWSQDSGGWHLFPAQ
jgi:hypothetical protein